jgi:hypothetical protein
VTPTGPAPRFSGLRTEFGLLGDPAVLLFAAGSRW